MKGVLGLVGAGAAVAAGMKGYEKLVEDPRKETRAESLERLLEEMEEGKLASVPTAEITGNENVLSAAGWTRLYKIMREHGIRPGGIDGRISFSELQELLNKEIEKNK